MKKFTEWMVENPDGKPIKEWSSGGMNFKNEHEKNMFWGVVHGFSPALKPIIKKTIEDFLKNDREASEEINRMDPELANKAIATILLRLANEYS